MSGMCGWCELPIWEMPETGLSLVADQPEDTPPEQRLIGGLIFCSQEHLDNFYKKHDHMTTGTKVVKWAVS